MSTNFIKLIAAGMIAAVAGQGMAQTIPLDKRVTKGKLANGFTYYIRKNNEPQKRVLFYLVNKVGSVLEDDDQRGLAHFMEHMNFNGTRHYPKNQLIDELQKAGVRFGADLNAYTGFDETVYQLPIPTDDPKMVPKGLKIMRDWAQEALLDPVEINKERGVVLEEKRLGKGADDRMSRQYYPILLNKARYADRLPIGTEDILLNFKAEAIKRFHHDWYRPDLQALIIVGDIDVNQIEKMVRTEFATLKNPVKVRQRSAYKIPLTGKNQFIAVTDKEQPTTAIQVFFKRRAQPVKTESDYVNLMKRSLFNRMLAARRYAENSRLSDPPYNNLTASSTSFLGGLDVFSFEVNTKAGRTKEGFVQAWEIIEKIKRYGFTQSEFEHAKQNFVRSMETNLREAGKTNSASFIAEYQANFLHQEAAPGIEWENAFVKKHIGDIKPDDINALSDEYITDANRDILILAPDREKGNLPDSSDVTGWIENARYAQISRYEEDTVSHPLMVTKPTPGKVMERTHNEALNLSVLKLSNGLTVVLKPTNFKNDEIRFSAFSPGGTSVYNDDDFDAAQSAAGLMSRFGIGDLNPVQLTKALDGKIVNVIADITPRSQVIRGTASPSDLETALQLTYLRFTAPRKDSTLFLNIINSAKENVRSNSANPSNVFTDTINYVMGNYAYRASPNTVERIDKITMQRSFDIYRERFGDASGFTFFFVGNFTETEIIPLLERYLGSLPSLRKNEKARDLGTHIPEGQLVKKVFRGSEDKALVRLVFSGDYEFSVINNLKFKALGDILQIKLLQHIREGEGEVYSPSVQIVYNKYPKQRFAMVVTFGCAPKNVDHLIAMVEQEMQDLRRNGPEALDLEKFKASYAKSMEQVLEDNSFWLSYLSGQSENGEDPLQILQVSKNLQQINQQSLKTAADVFLNGKNSISFELLPEASAKH